MAKILIVEDESKILHILEKIVKSDGHETLLAVNGEEGISLARKCVPDLILTDIYMPKVNGLQLCSELKYNKSTAKIAIIVITASSESPDLLKIFRYGANAWIKKPFQRLDILRTIETVSKERDLMAKQEILGNWIDFKLASSIEILQSVNRFIENLLSYSTIQPNDIKKLGFAINEMLINGMEHGNNFNFNKYVTVSYVLFKEKIILKIQDEGKGFLLADAPDPMENPVEVALRREKEGKRPGGYGIAITRQYVDEIEYNDIGNTCLMTKFINN
ncbi:response regulator [Fibrobacterota bacterium]